MLFLLGKLVFAQEFISDIGEPTELRSAGAWVRVIPDEEGWKVALGSNRSFYIADLYKTGDGLEDWEITPKEQVTDITDLVDHALKKCPDGTYLHIASGDAGDGTLNDMGHLWHYDADFNVLTYQPLTAGIGTHSHNDPNLVCSNVAKGVALSIQGMEFATDFFALNDDLEVEEIIAMEPYPRANGGGSFTDETEGVVHFIGMDHNRPLHINSYDMNWTLVGSTEVELLDAPLREYWPQGIIEVGEYYLVVHMGKDDAWLGSDKGDVFLSILDKQFEFVTQYRITTYEDGEAAMRPWIARRGSQLLFSFDAFGEQMIVEAILNLEEFGLSEESPDTGVKPDGYWAEEKTTECGCSGASAAISIPLIFIALIGIRARQ